MLLSHGQKHLLSWIKNSGLLEDLAHNGHSRVDRVRDDENKGLGAMFSARLRKITHNPGIDLLSFVTFEKNAESVKEMVLDEAGKGDE